MKNEKRKNGYGASERQDVTTLRWWPKEISREFDIFVDLRFSSLRELYRSMKKSIREE